MPHLSVVIPVYRAEDCLHELYRRLRAALESITGDFEIIMVEDCGGDRSWEIICELARNDPRVKGIQFSRNFGQHYGITAGLDRCDGDYVVIMDCDLQDRPEEISRLYAKAREGYDVVLARRGRRRHARSLRVWLTALCSRLFYRVLNYLADINYDAEVGNFRIVSRKVILNFRLFREKLRFFGALVDWMGFSTTAVDVEYSERYAGETTYTFPKLWKLGVETILSHSDKPLRMAIRFGFLMSGAAFLFALKIFYDALTRQSPVLGWSSLIVSLYFLSGLIILFLGILGLYLGKTFDETKRRPLYIVSRTTDEG